MAASRAYSRACYRVIPGKKRASSRQHYSANTEKKRAYSRQQYSANPSKYRLPHVHTWLSTVIICVLKKRAKYVLAEPKPDVKHMYVKDFQSQLLADAETFIEFITNSFYVQMAHPATLINTIIACFLYYLAV